jgi:hypothetical protein
LVTQAAQIMGGVPKTRAIALLRALSFACWLRRIRPFCGCGIDFLRARCIIYDMTGL